jgi:hypothetical protein
MAAQDRDTAYREILLEPLRKSADYLPKMGGGGEVDLGEFRLLYGADPLYHWMGLDSPMMFAAHKAAGGMTSIYRQLGIGCERLLRGILKDELNLTEEQVHWSYRVPAPSRSQREAGRMRELSLDGRIDLADIQSGDAKDRICGWIEERKQHLGITVPIGGAVFEVRQGYKSADSKRQNGDLANAAQAISKGYLPVLTIMSTQMNSAVHARYMSGNWVVLMGTLGKNDPDSSTFDFVKEIVGYDIAGFFERSSSALRREVESILGKLLEP